MNGKCEKCFYYSGDNVLLPHCFHLNSAIVPGWNKYDEDKDCPEFVDKEDYYNKLKAFLDANIDKYLKSEAEPTKDVTPDKSNEYIVVHGEPSLAYTTESLIAKINFTDTYYGKLFLDAIKQGQKLIIKPYGTTEYDNNGNVKNFNLIGFNICSEK